MLQYIAKSRDLIRKPVVSLEKHVAVRRRMTEEFRAAGLPPVPAKISFSREPRTSTEMILRKSGGGVVVLLSDHAPLARVRFISERIACHTYWFSQTSSAITEISCDLSDGYMPSFATYRFSVTPNVGIAVPDPYFFASRGYREMHQYAHAQTPQWDDRDDEIVWRGAPNNNGLFSLDPANMMNPGVQQRLRLALACQSLDVDFRFVAGGKTDAAPLLKAAGLVGDWQHPTSWASRKYAIDIDGWTNAWNNFMQRLALGCCVLKVDSQFGYSQWYYPRLKPWEHFVPIKADLSDFAEQIEWARTHPDRAREIAAAGQAVARSMTLESETRVAAEIIETHEANR